MKIESDDTVETIAAKAMKGVPDHQRQLMYPALISNICQQLLEWTLHLDDIIRKVVKSLKQEREKDEANSVRETQKLKNRLLQARKIIESQVKEMSDLEEKYRRSLRYYRRGTVFLSGLSRVNLSIENQANGANLGQELWHKSCKTS